MVDRKGMVESVMARPDARKFVLGGRIMKNVNGKWEKIVVRRIDYLFATTESPVEEGSQGAGHVHEGCGQATEKEVIDVRIF